MQNQKFSFFAAINT